MPWGAIPAASTRPLHKVHIHPTRAKGSTTTTIASRFCAEVAGRVPPRVLNMMLKRGAIGLKALFLLWMRPRRRVRSACRWCGSVKEILAVVQAVEPSVVVV
jgi:hypothetical protein